MPTNYNVNPHENSHNRINLDSDAKLLKENPLDYLYTDSVKEVNVTNTNFIKKSSYFNEYFNKDYANVLLCHLK